jgi:3'(2'), 5'-bisphosphate nucleotidase
MKDQNIDFLLAAAIEAAIHASADIMEIYATDFSVEHKSDASPVTLADQHADDSIRKYLLPTEIYVLSEEQPPLPFDERKNLEYLWIVDPLDGTKEFIKRNGEFTVNIALVKNGHPIIGIITAPALNICYWAAEGMGLFIRQVDEWKIDPLELIRSSEKMQPKINQVKIIGSRSHANVATQNYVNLLMAMHPDSQIINKGSSLKLCQVASGEASFYPRFSPINEWDIAAGAALVEISGGRVLDAATKKRVHFNKENLLQPPFIAVANGINPDTLP